MVGAYLSVKKVEGFYFSGFDFLGTIEFVWITNLAK